MKNYVALLALISALFFAEDSELDQILNENTDNINLSEESQQEVDSLATEKDSLLAEWKVVVKQVVASVARRTKVTMLKLVCRHKQKC